MRQRFGWAYGALLLLISGVGLPGAAWADEPAAENPSADKEPIRVTDNNRQIEIDADYSYTMRQHTEMKLLDQAAVNRLSQFALSYSENLQTLTVNSAFTLKADGRKLEVKPESMLTRQKNSTNPGVQFADTMQKVILFPNVEAGDTLVFDTTTHSKPLIGGFFFYGTVTPKTLPIDRQTETLSAPKSLALHVEHFGYDMKTGTNGDRTVYTFTFANAHPAPKDDQYVSVTTRAPRFLISTFKDYGQFAETIDAMMRDRTAVTPEIQAKADEIAAGTSDRREQARKIYEWVSTHVRYVAIEFGVGGIVPHPAAEVMQNAYGDCKDHAALLTALLKAKGIDSSIVLINATTAYVLPSVPTTSAFNHAINWLPEFGLYADTTPGRLPFGLLPFSEYGKPVIRLGAKDGAVATIPPMNKTASAVRMVNDFKLDADGVLHGDNKTTVVGPLVNTYRKTAIAVGTKPEATAKEMLKKRGYEEAGGRFVFSPDSDFVDSYSFSSHFDAADQKRMLSGKSFRIPFGLTLINAIDEAFIGPIVDKRYKDADPVACHGGHATEDISFAPPKGKRLAELPQDAHIATKDAGLAYDTHWSMDGGTLRLHRELTADFTGPLCAGPARKDAVAALDKIREDYKTEISLVDAKP
jgi:transglutaminase-like putative cysteine protease